MRYSAAKAAALHFLTVGEHADGHPNRWRGTISADALSAYDCLLEVHDDARLEAGCSAHGLRKFRDEADKAPLLASTALAYPGRLFATERDARAQALKGVAQLAHRQPHAKPIANEFRKWLDANFTDLLPSNPVRKAMQLCVNHWAALMRFLNDADIPIDNTGARALRNVVLLRRYSVYASVEDGAVRLCNLFTLIHTCRLPGVDPNEYLVWALARSVPHSTNRGLAAFELTPPVHKAPHKASA